MESKQCQVINNLLSFFWCYVNFLSLAFFLFTFCFEVILSAILFPIKSPVVSDVFWATHFEAVFAASIPVFVPVSFNFLLYLSINFIGNDKNPYFLTYFMYFGSVEYLIFIIFTYTSISSGLLLWSVNHTWMDWNHGLVVFSIIDTWGEIVINWLNCLLGTKINNTLDTCWQPLLTKLQCTKKTSADSSFGASSPSLSLTTSFIVLAGDFIVLSGDSSSSLYPAFALKTSRFLILFG